MPDGDDGSAIAQKKRIAGQQSSLGSGLGTMKVGAPPSAAPKTRLWPAGSVSDAFFVQPCWKRMSAMTLKVLECGQNSCNTRGL
tara:strand:+ start:47 stop:298 length:252 start_codon:yes stop_codon:yes gene_type:complete